MTNLKTRNCALALVIVASFVDVSFVSAQNPRLATPATGNSSQGGSSATGVNQGTNSMMAPVPQSPTTILQNNVPDPNIQNNADAGIPPRDTIFQTTLATKNIREAILNDPTLAGPARNIQITAQGESLTLSGYVMNSSDRDAIDRIARDNAGTLRIINSVRVR